MGDLLAAWYAEHPIEARWHTAYDLLATDPLRVDIDDAAIASDDPTLLPWARLLRSLEICDGGVVFHHGVSAREVKLVLQDPNAPTFEAFRTPYVVEEDASDAAEWDAIVELIIDHPNMRGIHHLGLVAGITPRHVRRVLGSARAARLRSLDLCERLLDHEEDEVLATLNAMGGLQDIEHLNLYGNVRTAAHVRALTAHEFPKLTHLSLGPAAVDDELTEVLRASDAFPALRALYLSSPSPALRTWMESRGIASDVVAAMP